ncbi:hypothetical protein ACQ4PT_063736 [Festuca glaucescens]
MGQAVSADSSSSRRSQPPPPAPLASAPAKAAKDPDTELMRVFKSFDADADGRVSASEIQKLRRCTTAEAKEMVAVVDSDEDGFISIEEFGALLEDGDSDALALRMAFEEYDENGDGMITAEELCRALRRVLPGEDLTVEQCSMMIAAVDKDGDGLISFDEFKAMMGTKSS